MTEEKQEDNFTLRQRYAEVRPIVQRSIKKGLQSPRAKPSDVRSLRRGAFFAAEEAIENSMIDTLTGLPNRKWMERELRMKAAHASRTGTSFRIVILDLDHFKWINDRYGHPVGDEILQCMRILSTRKEEPIARWGGEEFLQILENGSNSQNIATVTTRHMNRLKELTKRVLEKYNDNPQADSQQELTEVTMSGGVVDYDPNMSIENLIKSADEALYIAKEKGRNRMVYAQSNGVNNYSFVELSKINQS